jgi:hypothetical protein
MFVTHDFGDWKVQTAWQLHPGEYNPLAASQHCREVGSELATCRRARCTVWSFFKIACFWSLKK